MNILPLIFIRIYLKSFFKHVIHRTNNGWGDKKNDENSVLTSWMSQKLFSQSIKNETFHVSFITFNNLFGLWNRSGFDKFLHWV